MTHLRLSVNEDLQAGGVDVNFANRRSTIYFMPILNVDESQSIIVLKRSMNTGFAGIDHDEKTQLLFGHAKDSISKVVKDVEEL